MNGQPVARETAWRVFSGEFNNSSLKLEKEDERAPSYVVTPLGARVNRLYIVGVLTEVENRGSDEEPFWLGRISDPTGVFYISAGQYRPSAAKVLRDLQDKTPCYVALPGKARTYERDDGEMNVSVMPEEIMVVDSETRAHWILDTAKHTRKRINAVTDAMELDSPTVDALMDRGYSRPLAEGVIAAVQHYGDAGLEMYKAMLVDALRSLLPEYSALQMSPELSKPVKTPPAVSEPAPAPAVAETPVGMEGGKKDDEIPTDEEFEEVVQKIIEKLDVDDDGAPYKEVSSEAAKQNIDREKLEEIVNSLLDQGLVYEPVLGRLKII
jgi:RPA family protein